MEKREDGIYIPNEDIRKVKNVIGYIGIGFFGIELIRFTFRSRNGRKA